jgi:hypothetical protein
MENKNSQPYVVEGYTFYTEKDAELAKVELQKKEYLHSRIDYDKPESVLRIYDKAVDDRIFKTPLGLDFLKEIREYLLKCPDIPNEKVRAVPVTANFEGVVREQASPARTRIKPSDKKTKDAKAQALLISVMLNIVLVIAVIAMFAITLNADQPNVLNYEKVLTDRYASWEQQLTEREEAVREKERELNIEFE